MVNAWLKQPPRSQETTMEFIDRIFGVGGTECLKGVGGFSLVCGLLRKRGNGMAPLAVLSNRTPNIDSIPWIASTVGKTHGLSNSSYDDPWHKVSLGKSLLDQAVKRNVESKQSEKKLLEGLFDVLDNDTFPTPRPGQSQKSLMEHLSNSIFIPALRPDSDTPLPEKPFVSDGASKSDQRALSTVPPYGTQKQTVILVRQDGRVLYMERTLFDNNLQPIKETRRFEFVLDGWRDSES
jgi:hypothetical protein